ncbi:MAG: TasA family protein [Coprobacillus sp.]
MKKKMALIMLGFGLIMTITVGGTYAVFQADGEAVTTQMTTTSLDISLEGSRSQIQFDNLVAGQPISKQLSVKNTKETPLYTRVTIKKYWLNANNEKDFDASSSQIKLNYNQKEWLRASNDENGEEVVLYYKNALAQNQKTENFLESIVVPKDLGNADQGKKFALDIRVDAIQAYNVKDAMLNQWGVLANVDQNGLISKIER